MLSGVCKRSEQPCDGAARCRGPVRHGSVVSLISSRAQRAGRGRPRRTVGLSAWGLGDDLSLLVSGL